MPGKRKVDDMSVSEPQEKLSKKAKLKLARERAAEFAKRDKERLQAKKAGKAPTLKSSSTPKASSTPKNVATTPTSTIKSPKMSNSERKKIAKQNAKEFAARDKATLAKKKAAASSPFYKSESPKPPPVNQNLGAVIDPSQVQAYEQMRQVQQVAQQQQVIAQQQTLNRTISVQSDDEEDNEDDIPPPPPALMAQVSTQVLLNARKATVVDSEDEAENAEEIEPLVSNEISDIPKPEPIREMEPPVDETKPKSGWLSKVFYLTVIAAVGIGFVTLDVPSMDLSSIELPSFELPSIDFLISPDEDVLEEIPCYLDEYATGCANGGVPCPSCGVCEGGKLIHCRNSFQEVSDRGDKCELGEDNVRMKHVLIDALVELSMTICDQSFRPLFPYNELQQAHPEILPQESQDLIEALKIEGFGVREMDNLLVGLPEDFKMSLPLYCTLGNIGQWLLQEVGLLLLGILKFVATNFIGFVSSYPKQSGVMLVLFIVINKIRSYLAHRKKIQKDIIQTRKIAYKTLEESAGVEHYATHIRDEIAMALYPDSKKLRLEMQKKVWPKIVDDIKRDTRVRKFQKMNRDGRTRDMWQWTAASKPSTQS